MILIFWMKKVVATLAQEIGRNVSENIHDALIDERELSVHRMARDKLRLIVGPVKIGGIGCRCYLQATDCDQTAVRRVHVVFVLTVELDAWKDIY